MVNLFNFKKYQDTFGYLEKNTYLYKYIKEMEKTLKDFLSRKKEYVSGKNKLKSVYYEWWLARQKSDSFVEKHGEYIKTYKLFCNKVNKMLPNELFFDKKFVNVENFTYFCDIQTNQEGLKLDKNNVFPLTNFIIK